MFNFEAARGYESGSLFGRRKAGEADDSGGGDLDSRRTAGTDRSGGKRRGMSRSKFILTAAQHELTWPDPARIDAAIERGRAALAGAGRFESADLIRADRDAHDDRDRRR